MFVFHLFFCKSFVVGAGLKAWIQAPIEEMPFFAYSGVKHSSCYGEGQLCPP